MNKSPSIIVGRFIYNLYPVIFRYICFMCSENGRPAGKKYYGTQSSAKQLQNMWPVGSIVWLLLCLNFCVSVNLAPGGEEAGPWGGKIPLVASPEMHPPVIS